MREIDRIKVWKKHPTIKNSECRIYITFKGIEKQGCYYLTGNNWNTAKSIENMTDEELKAAKALALKENDKGSKSWTDWYSTPKPVSNWRPDEEEQEQIDNDSAADGFGGRRLTEY